MKKFQKIFKRQLILLPLLGVILIIIGAVRHEIDKNSYTVVSKEEFTKIALNKSISDFRRSGYRIEMKVDSGEKYFHEFESAKAQEEFDDLILNNLNSLTYRQPIQFYETGISLVLSVIIGIILFNVFVVLWFVAFYDLLKSEFKENHNKWIWFLSFIILFLIAPLFYMLISNEQKRSE